MSGPSRRECTFFPQRGTCDRSGSARTQLCIKGERGSSICTNRVYLIFARGGPILSIKHGLSRLTVRIHRSGWQAWMRGVREREGGWCGVQIRANMWLRITAANTHLLEFRLSHTPQHVGAGTWRSQVQQLAEFECHNDYFFKAEWNHDCMFEMCLSWELHNATAVVGT